MNILIKDPKVVNIDSVLTPEDKIIFRCVDCQTFLLPKWLHMVVFRLRDRRTGQAKAIPVEVCPVCYDKIGQQEVAQGVRENDIPRSHFVTLTRHDYEMTKKAEAVGMLYDERAKIMKPKSSLILPT